MEDVKTRRPRRTAVKLLRGYVPAGAYSQITENGGKEEIEPQGTTFVRHKVAAGTTIELDTDEARHMVKARIAERADQGGW